VHKADNLPPSCAVVTKSGNLHFVEPSGPFRACKGTDLPLPLPKSVWKLRQGIAYDDDCSVGHTAFRLDFVSPDVYWNL